MKWVLAHLPFTPAVSSTPAPGPFVVSCLPWNGPFTALGTEVVHQACPCGHSEDSAGAVHLRWRQPGRSKTVASGGDWTNVCLPTYWHWSPDCFCDSLCWPVQAYVVARYGQHAFGSLPPLRRGDKRRGEEWHTSPEQHCLAFALMLDISVPLATFWRPCSSLPDSCGKWCAPPPPTHT